MRLRRSDIWSMAFWYSRFMSSNCFFIWSSSLRSVSASWAWAGPAASTAPSTNTPTIHLRMSSPPAERDGVAGQLPEQELSQELRGGSRSGGARGSARQRGVTARTATATGDGRGASASSTGVGSGLSGTRPPATVARVQRSWSWLKRPGRRAEVLVGQRAVPEQEGHAGPGRGAASRRRSTIIALGSLASTAIDLQRVPPLRPHGRGPGWRDREGESGLDHVAVDGQHPVAHGVAPRGEGRQGHDEHLGVVPIERARPSGRPGPRRRPRRTPRA